MRVTYVLGTSAGGTGRHVRMLAGGLAARGMTVSVYGPAGTWTAASTAAVEFAAVGIADRPRPARDLAAIRRLRTLLAGSRPDIVHAHGLRAGALAAAALGLRGNRPRLVVTVHNAPPDGGPAVAVYLVLEQVVARRADTVLCVSGDLEARMRRLGARGVARALVSAPPAPPCVPADARAAIRAELGLAVDPGRARVILAVGRLAPQKGFGTLVDAAARWRDRGPAPLLVIAGAGPLHDDLTRRAKASGARVRFLGQRSDVQALLAAADVVVLPSRWEGQPLIVQETLRAGRPLVASRVGGIPELTGEDAALLIPPGDPAALAAAVLAALDDPGLSARLSQAAIKRAGTLPSEDDALDAALSAYGSLGTATSG